MNDTSCNQSEGHNQKIKKFKNRMELKETAFDKVADFMTSYFGTMTFLIVNAVFFLIWILINTGLTPLKAFDPFPFGLLTTIVSLEAIFLSIIVLISQNRASQIAELRSEIDFEINVRSENEVTRILNMLDAIHDHLGLDPEDDEELIEMKQKTNITMLKDDLLGDK